MGKERRRRQRKELSIGLHPCHSMCHHGSIVFFLALPLKGEESWVSRVKACALCLAILCRPATKIRPRCFSPELDERLSLLQIGPPGARRWNRRLDELRICFWREANHAFISICKLWKIGSLTMMAEKKLSGPGMLAGQRV